MRLVDISGGLDVHGPGSALSPPHHSGTRRGIAVAPSRSKDCQVSGRIDHMAVDLPRERLFVAELEKGTVGVIDLRAKGGLRRLKGFREPQGVGFVGSTDTLYVASGGDGSLRVFHGPGLRKGERSSSGMTQTTSSSSLTRSACSWATVAAL